MQLLDNALNKSVLVVYLISYVLLTAAFALYLATNKRAILSNIGSAQTLASTTSNPQAKALAVVVISAMAGLPPFFFFIPKAAVLSLLVSKAHWGLVVCFLSGLFLSWYVYYTFGSTSAQAAHYNSPSSPCKGSTKGSELMLTALLVCLLFAGAFFFEDILLLSL